MLKKADNVFATRKSCMQTHNNVIIFEDTHQAIDRINFTMAAVYFLAVCRK